MTIQIHESKSTWMLSCILALFIPMILYMVLQSNSLVQLHKINNYKFLITKMDSISTRGIQDSNSYYCFVSLLGKCQYFIINIDRYCSHNGCFSPFTFHVSVSSIGFESPLFWSNCNRQSCNLYVGHWSSNSLLSV